MKYKQLGKTNLRVSAIGFGSVEIGQDYGICVPGDYGKPDRRSSIELIRMAVDSGVNLFDTAPSYGDSEKVLGETIGSHCDCYIATKVNNPPEGGNTSEVIKASIEQSCHNLKRECLDIVQIHNATVNTIYQTDIPEILVEMRAKGKVKYIGASVYGAKNAQAVVKAGCFDVVQIAYNVLDQRMAEEVMPLVIKHGVGTLARSPYLKGVLTCKAEYLPSDCRPLREASEQLKGFMSIQTWDELASFALQFCLSSAEINSVIVGIRTKNELETAIQVEKNGKLPSDIYERAQNLGLKDEYWLNPVNWPMP